MAGVAPIEFMSSQEDNADLMLNGDGGGAFPEHDGEFPVDRKEIEHADHRSMSRSRSPRTRRDRSPQWERDAGDAALLSPVPSRTPRQRPSLAGGSSASVKRHRSSSGFQRQRSRSHSPRRSEPARLRTTPVIVKKCTVCDVILESGERMYKNCQMHYSCGSKQAAAMTYFRTNAEVQSNAVSLKSDNQSVLFILKNTFQVSFIFFEGWEHSPVEAAVT